MENSTYELFHFLGELHFDSNLIAFDFRYNATDPEVIFIITSQLEEGDNAISHICPSFNTLFSIL
ncbi:hypothetical protein DRB05_13005 [Pseudoalteromonas sp. A757]|nr:hypothetical protein DRB05_13005 [Pseudoalteromonas sp. A757]